MNKTLAPQPAANKVHEFPSRRQGAEFCAIARRGEKALAEAQQQRTAEFRAAETQSEIRACLWMALGDAGKRWFMGMQLPDFPRRAMSARQRDQGAKYAAWMMSEMGLDVLVAFAQGGENAPSGAEAIAAIEKFAEEFPASGVAAKYYFREPYIIGAMAFAYKRFLDSGDYGFADRTFKAMDLVRSKEMDPHHLPHIAAISENISDGFLIQTPLQWRAEQMWRAHNPHP